MPLLKSKSKKAVGENIKTEMENGKPHKQAIAIALSVQRKARGQKMAKGGQPKLGSGKRFEYLEHSLAHKEGISDPAAVAASIGRKKYGSKKMAKLAAHGRKHHYEGGEIDADSRDEEELGMLKGHSSEHEQEMRAASMRPDADESDPREMDMMHGSEHEHSEEIDARKEHMAGIDDAIDDAMDEREMAMMRRKKMAKGGEVDARDESMSMNSIDDAASERDEHMLDSHSSRHMDEIRAASGMPGEDEEDEREMDMMHQHDQEDSYSKDGIVRYAKGGEIRAASRRPDVDNDEERPGSIAEAIMRKRRMMAEGGEVDLDENAEEHHNHYDDLNEMAADRESYSEEAALHDQPMDSNEHGHDLPDEDEHDMVSKIRSKIRSKRMY